MKKISAICAFIALFLSLSPLFIRNSSLSAYAADEPSEETIDETIDEIIAETDLSEYEEFLKELQILGEEYTVYELVRSVLNNDFELDFGYFTSYLAQSFFGNIKGLLAQAIIILITVVLMSILNNLTSGFSRPSTKKIVYVACYGSIITVVGIMVGTGIASASEFIKNVTAFTDVVFPVLLTLVTAIGATASAAVYQPLIVVFASLILKIINYVVMPAFFISLVFNVIGNLSDDLKLGKIAGFAKSVGEWVVGVCFGLFVTYATARGITGAGIDSLAAKGAKYALSSYVPVIGNYLKDGFDIITASCIVIKNSLGLVSIVILLLFSVAPLMKILSTMLILRLTAAICEPFGDKKISDMLHGVSKSMVMPLIACISVVFSLLVLIMLIILTCNRGIV